MLSLSAVHISCTENGEGHPLRHSWCCLLLINLPLKPTMGAYSIAGFHCHTIIKTIHQVKSRIKEIKEDEYSNSLAKIQVCEMFRAGDIQINVLLKILIHQAIYEDAMFVTL